MNVKLNSTAEEWASNETNYSTTASPQISWPINRSVSSEAFYFLIISYALLGLCGVIGNLLVCSVVIRNKQMRTSKNMLIVNLAVSDLVLCLFTMPFSLVQIITKYWPLGEFMCKAVASLQAISVFVSTITITLIAADRYTAIVNGKRGNIGARPKYSGVAYKVTIIFSTTKLFGIMSRPFLKAFEELHRSWYRS